MPELPDITIYLERIRAVAEGRALTALRIGSPFVLRTVEPRPEELEGEVLASVERIGKRIVLGFSGQRFAVMHLMIAGRLHWREPGVALSRKIGLAAFDFPDGTLLLTEAGSKRRASLHLVIGAERLSHFERGGVDVFSASTAAFGEAIRHRNRTLKRALTDPSIVDGIGNAYSDEILHRARMSPFKLTSDLTDAEVEALQSACVGVLNEWIDRLRLDVGTGFPKKVTAFRPEMAVHGRYGDACPDCGAPVQRIRYADKESNYCPGCQTGGRIFADRSLSRLLKEDWPKTLAELEELEERRST